MAVETTQAKQLGSAFLKGQTARLSYCHDGYCENVFVSCWPCLLWTLFSFEELLSYSGGLRTNLKPSIESRLLTLKRPH